MMNMLKLIQFFSNKLFSKLINKYYATKLVSKPSKLIQIVSMPLRHWLINAKKRDLFLAAMRIAEELGWESALRFVRESNTYKRPRALNIILANQHISSELAWQSYLNEYLNSFHLQPVYQIPKKANKFDGISSKAKEFSQPTELISIVMTAFNAAATIEKSVDSILNQTIKNIQLIIVDDCSTDDTWQVIQRLVQKDGRVNAIKNSYNVGPYVSKNIGLRFAQGKYFTCHDADDWAHPQRIENDYLALNNNSASVHAVVSCMLRMYRTGEFSKFAKLDTFPYDGVARIAPVTLFMETEFFKKYFGAWDCVRFGGDNEILERCKKVLGSKIYFNDTIALISLDSPNSLTNHPVTGVSRTEGPSLDRLNYAKSFRQWHQTIDLSNCRLEFTALHDKYVVPPSMRVNADDFDKNNESISV